MASPKRRTGDPRRAGDDAGARNDRMGTAWQRPHEQPMWIRAMYGIGWVVAMAVTVTLVGLALSLLATLVL